MLNCESVIFEKGSENASHHSLRHQVSSRQNLATVMPEAGVINALESVKLSLNNVTMTGAEGSYTNIKLEPKSTLNIENSTFTSNNGKEASLVQTQDSTLNIKKSLFLGNKGEKGGVFDIRGKSNLMVSECEFNGNMADNGAVVLMAIDDNSEISVSMTKSEFLNNYVSGIGKIQLIMFDCNLSDK